MSDTERPRPQYGEYATPEEQRARIKQPDMTWLLETGQDPDALKGAPPADSPTVPAAPSGVSSATPTMRRGRFADRVATIALLVYGLVNVVTSIPSMLDYQAYVTTVLGILGIDGQLADPAADRPWGIAAALVLAIGWLLTAWVSWRRLAKERLTWWIPLVAGIVFTGISGVLLMVPIASDPVLWNAILDSAR
ncbi:hypothetical protein SAMN04487846_2400 [Microbacterium sp. cf046]|uniref:DUF6264 family protein n=1 Tax=Microbacterium sp. cf046 TaxID=1761803 RepID=UPI0008E47AA4|nr:DUF6264 family protein [Microbacterium sp. cf046]SFS08583.1 hypothetical protein SAMN04487846_2400 [Microbacterium sp. cf046]